MKSSRPADEVLRRVFAALAEIAREAPDLVSLALRIDRPDGSVLLEDGTGVAPVETHVCHLASDGVRIGMLRAGFLSVPQSSVDSHGIWFEKLRRCAVHLGFAIHAVEDARLKRVEVDDFDGGAGNLAPGDPGDVARRAILRVAEIVPAPVEAALYVVSDDGKALVLLASTFADDRVEYVQTLHKPIATLAHIRRISFEQRRTTYSPDVLLEPGAELDVVKRLEVRSLLVVPVRSGTRSLGLLHVSHPAPSHVFSEHERGLLEGIAARIGHAIETAQLAHENQQRLEDLQALSRRLWTVQEEERRRIARELHDEAGQSMTALKLNLDLAKRETDEKRIRARVVDAAALAVTVLDDLRRIARDLRPGALDDLGLIAAVRALVDGFSERSHMESAFVHDGSAVPPPDSDAAATVFRFVQEALTNVARHARASQVRVGIRAEEGMLSVEVEDDGIGFDATALRPPSAGRLGLLDMRERARMLGGRLVAESGDGQGACLRLEIPVRTWEGERR